MPEILLLFLFFWFGSNLSTARVIVLGCCWILIQACLVLLGLIMLVIVTGLCVGWRGSDCCWLLLCDCC